MSPIMATKFVILFSLIVLILFDIVIYYYGGRDATISTVIYRFSLDNPVIPFAAGFLCGHLFWRD